MIKEMTEWEKEIAIYFCTNICPKYQRKCKNETARLNCGINKKFREHEQQQIKKAVEEFKDIILFQILDINASEIVDEIEKVFLKSRGIK